MSTDNIDNDLFPSKAEADEANAAWSAGQAENDKAKPTGSFTVKIEKAEVGRSSSSGRLQIHYQLLVTSGPSAGITLHKYDGLGTPKQAAITQQQLTRIGVSVTGVTLSMLPAVLAGVVGLDVAVQGRVSGDFHNIFFNRVVETASAGPGAASDAPF